jgi:hypothetical protein
VLSSLSNYNLEKITLGQKSNFKICFPSLRNLPSLQQGFSNLNKRPRERQNVYNDALVSPSGSQQLGADKMSVHKLVRRRSPAMYKLHYIPELEDAEKSLTHGYQLVN